MSTTLAVDRSLWPFYLLYLHSIQGTQMCTGLVKEEQYPNDEAAAGDLEKNAEMANTRSQYHTAWATVYEGNRVVRTFILAGEPDPKNIKYSQNILTTITVPRKAKS